MTELEWIEYRAAMQSFHHSRGQFYSGSQFVPGPAAPFKPEPHRTDYVREAQAIEDDARPDPIGQREFELWAENMLRRKQRRQLRRYLDNDHHYIESMFALFARGRAKVFI